MVFWSLRSARIKLRTDVLAENKYPKIRQVAKRVSVNIDKHGRPRLLPVLSI